jgi:hypothetical protein
MLGSAGATSPSQFSMSAMLLPLIAGNQEVRTGTSSNGIMSSPNFIRIRSMPLELRQGESCVRVTSFTLRKRCETIIETSAYVIHPAMHTSFVISK